MIHDIGTLGQLVDFSRGYTEGDEARIVADIDMEAVYGLRFPRSLTFSIGEHTITSTAPNKTTVAGTHNVFDFCAPSVKIVAIPDVSGKRGGFQGFNASGKLLIKNWWAENGLQTMVKVSECQYFRSLGVRYSGCNYAGLWVSDCYNACVQASEIDNIYSEDFGYGIWFGGSGRKDHQYLLAMDNVFDKVRHCVDAHYGAVHYHAHRNQIHETLKHCFGRHGEDGVSYGHTTVTCNEFWYPGKRYAFSMPPPAEMASITITGNSFNTALGRTGEIGKLKDSETVNMNHNVCIANNTYPTPL